MTAGAAPRISLVVLGADPGANPGALAATHSSATLPRSSDVSAAPSPVVPQTKAPSTPSAASAAACLAMVPASRVPSAWKGVKAAAMIEKGVVTRVSCAEAM